MEKQQQNKQNFTQLSSNNDDKELAADLWVAVFKVRFKQISKNLGSCHYKLAVTEILILQFFLWNFTHNAKAMNIVIAH